MEYDELYMIEKQDEINVIETVDVIEVEDFETYTIDSEVAFPSLGEPNEKLKHSLLNGRELEDQHPITAITGLRAELDDIEALDVVYSNQKNQADYYEWEDENILQENRIGLFVTLCEDINKIKICTESDEILGVVTDVAGFVGGQADITRDYKYGLVVTSGVVHARCELEVAKGDFVIPNRYGVARKTNNNYGCKVIALHSINGIIYAAILLETSANQLYTAGEGIKELDGRVDNVEKNVVVAINEANKANNKIDNLDLETFKENINNSIQESNDKIDSVIQTDEVYRQQIASAVESSEVAKTIANSAATSAESLRNEAVTKATEALEEVEAVKDRIAQEVAGANAELEYRVSELQKTTEELDNTNKELRDNLKSAVEDIEGLEGDIEPLAEWTDGTNTGVAGFVAKAKEDSTTLAGIASWKGNAGESLAGFVADATENNATVKSIASYQKKNEDGTITEGAAGLIAQVNENGENVVSLTTSLGDNIAGLRAQVDENTSSVSTLASHVIGDYVTVETWSETDKDTSKVYYAKNTKHYYYYKDDVWISTDKPYEARLNGSLAGVQQIADDNKAQIDVLAEFTYGNDLSMYPYINSPKNDKDEYGGDVDTQKGIVFTDNGDETITANGTATENADFYIMQNNVNLELGDYSLSGCPEGGSSSSYFIMVKFEDTDGNVKTYEQTGEEYSFTIDNKYAISIWIRIKSGTTVSNLKFTPKLKQYYSGISGLKNQVAKNGASIDLLTNFASDSGVGAAGLVVTVGNHDAKLNALTSWKDETAKSLTSIQQQSDANKANIGIIATWQENLDIGGTNLLSYSRLVQQSGTLETSDDGIIEVKQGAWYLRLPNAGLQPNTEYTISVEEITNSNGNSNFVNAVQCVVGAWIQIPGFLSSAQKKITFTTKSTVVPDDDFSLYITTDSTLVDVTIKKIKLEKGNVATDWSPAPEDTTKAIASISQKAGANGTAIEGLVSWQGDTNDSIARIEQKADDNGASITSFVSSIDKYSVGEYSQSYGLTQEQAKNILKKDMIYIPTKHSNSDSHQEKYLDTEEINEFTQGYYYTWNGNDWDESTVGAVAFSSQMPEGSESVKYWYIDSDTAPEGYEPKALYKYEDEKWKKVNILDGNTTNRVVSMIQQRTDKISMDLVNARGDITTHQQWLDDNSANIQDVVTWKSNVKEDVSNIATIKQTANAAGASIAQVASTILTEYITEETWDEIDKDSAKVYYVKSENQYYYYDYENDEWQSTSSPIEAGLEVNAASIITAINNSDSTVKIKADHVEVEGVHVNLGGQTININADDVLGIESTNFSVDTEGYITATGGNIGGWKIEGKRAQIGKVLFIGDSYAFDNSDNTQYLKGWPEYCAENLKLKKDDYYVSRGAAYGFLSGKEYVTYNDEDKEIDGNYFLKLFNNGINTVTQDKGQDKGWEPSDISHIIIGGGFHDKTTDVDKTNGRTIDGLKQAMATLNNRIQSVFGSNKPSIMLFAMGKSKTYQLKNNDLEYIYDNAYAEECTECKWTYYDIHNAWGGENGQNYCSDDYNPNTKGVQRLGTIVASCLYNKGKLYSRASGGSDSFTSGITVESSAPAGVAFWAGYSGDYDTPIQDYGVNGDSWKKKTPFYVQNNGSLKATLGQIGGWTISDNYLKSTVGTTKKSITLASTSDSGNYWIKTTDANDKETFVLKKDGSITATTGSFGRDIKIANKPLSKWIDDAGDVYYVNASAGNIGNWNIDGTSLYTDSMEIPEGHGMLGNALKLIGEGNFGVKLDNFGITLRLNNKDTKYTVSWAELIFAKREFDMEQFEE